MRYLKEAASWHFEARMLSERVSNRLDTAQSDSVNCKFMAARVESRESRKENRMVRSTERHSS